MYTILYILFFIFWILRSNNCLSDPVIVTKYGKIRGTTLKTLNGQSFYAFRGIRYARVPSARSIYGGAELVNETWNNLPNNQSAINRQPVIVYIHGGGLYVGSGNVGPKYIMDHNIVLVTFNYRLGSIGFLSLNIPEVPGNAGFKDQVLALRWIQQNIEYFGGDLNSITLMGNSAGGLSAALHMISPMSQNLFHKIILMSPTFGFQTPVAHLHQLNLARKQAALMNCSNITNADSIYNCLIAVDPVAMSQDLYSMFEFGRDNPIILWNAVVEPDFGQERFLIEGIRSAFQGGRYRKIPVLIGLTENEFATSAVDIIKNSTLLEALDENFTKIVPICLALERHTDRSRNMSEQIWNFYNLTSPLGIQHLKQLNWIFSDGWIGSGVKTFLDIVQDKLEVFYYQFNYRGRYSYLYYPDDKPYGVEHGDDLFYLFNGPEFGLNDREMTAVNLMTELWHRFARNGNPNNQDDQIMNGFNWMPYTSQSHNYLDIGENTTSKINLLEDRLGFWTELLAEF